MPDENAGQPGGLSQLIQMLTRTLTPAPRPSTANIPGLMDAKIKANEIPTDSPGNLPPGLLNQLMKDPRFLQYMQTLNMKTGQAMQKPIDPSTVQPIPPMDLKPIGPAKQAGSDLDPEVQAEMARRQKMQTALGQ